MEEKIPGSENIRLSDAEYQRFGERLSEQIESFRFPGLTPTSYAKLKAESDEFAGLPELVHIDELLKNLETHGAKVVVAENGNAFIMPANFSVSNDTLDNNTVRPQTLEVTADMDPDLQKLILARR